MTFRCVAYYRIHPLTCHPEKNVSGLASDSAWWGGRESDLVREGVAMHLKVEERCRYAYCDSLFEVHGDRVVQEA